MAAPGTSRVVSQPNEFDLLPDPRILPMLGEINLPQWRCIAELIDNGVDGFLSQVRNAELLGEAQISINLPTKDDPTSQLTVSDNGPGMTPERLEMAMRAGWSGNNPIDCLGMFGMGFNIATARLGTVTTVWTGSKGETVEHGLRIDFDELRRQRHFRTPRLTRPKTEASASGTHITIEKLKPEQRSWFAKQANRTAIKLELAKTYSAMLRANGVPISFKLLLNGRLVSSYQHCVWDEARSVSTPRHGLVHAVQRVEQQLPDRPFCTACWQWLGSSDTLCAGCTSDRHVTQRKRHVHGWIGLQRYLSESDYGIDFIRNGRKIEIGNRDLFHWRNADSLVDEVEYPIDDPRHRGRFVGEIHLDHCRVTYMKDRFDRTDPAWEDMVGIVKGLGPLQPQKAASLGFAANDSPLFKLFQVFRRSTPKSRVAGCHANILAVPDNALAEGMAKKFRSGEPEYQTDAKWFELVEEADTLLLTGKSGGAPSNVGPGAPTLPGFTTPTPFTGDDHDAGGLPRSPENDTALPERRIIASLTREFQVTPTAQRFDVRAFQVDGSDPGLGQSERPWAARRQPDATIEFLVNPEHPVFCSTTMTVLDALLCELAWKAADFVRNQRDAAQFSDILAALRDDYGGPVKLDPIALVNSTELLFRQIATTWRHAAEGGEAALLYGGLSPEARQSIQYRMASRGATNPQLVIDEGRFLEFAPPRVIADFSMTHPELFFDGRCWDDAYSTLNYLDEGATTEARRRVVQHYQALMHDAVWLSEQDAGALQCASRERVVRASLAVNLLTPTPTDQSGDQD